MREVNQELVSIDGAFGRLAGELRWSTEEPVCSCLIINPHPLMGGQMDNNLVVALATDLAELNLAVLRFDYGGVGESEGQPINIAEVMNEFWATGHAPNDPAKILDAQAACDWLTRELQQPVMLIGYSFGAYVASQVARDQTPAIVLISPTLEQHDFSRLEGVNTPTLLICGDDDFATDPKAVHAWAAAADRRCTCVQIDDGEHFFRGVESQVTAAVRTFLAHNVADVVPAGLREGLEVSR